MELLFLAHRVPFPPDRGDRIRGYHVLHYLTKRARVHLVAFADDPRDCDPAPAFRSMLTECVIVPRTKSRPRALVEAMAGGKPVSLTSFADRRITAAVDDIMTRRPIAGAYVFSGQMAQYMPRDGTRAIMDFVDLDSAKFAAYAGDTAGPLRWLYSREARLLGTFERGVAARADASVFVSDAEAALLPGAHTVENGIDADRFAPATVAPVPADGPLIVFTGQMDYPPNVAAVRWFVAEVLPAIRAARPNARFAIVGRAPTAAVRALASPAVLVTGEVADVRGWLAAAAVVVAPLRLARGVQNKVLEAMAMARPVVATPAAAEGIDHAGSISVADEDAFAGAVLALLGDRVAAQALGQHARAHVLARYDWDARLAPLDSLLGLAGRAAA